MAIGRLSVELAMEWLFSHLEEPNVEDDELARALAMSLAPAPVSEKELLKLPLADKVLAPALALLERSESAAFPVEDLLLAMGQRGDGAACPQVAESVLRRLSEAGERGGSSTQARSAAARLLAVLVGEDAAARDLAAKGGAVGLGGTKKKAPKTVQYEMLQRLLHEGGACGANGATNYSLLLQCGDVEANPGPPKLVVEYNLFYLGQSQPIGEKDVVVVEVEGGSSPLVLARDIKVAIKTQRATRLPHCDAADIALADAASDVMVPSDDITTFVESGRVLKALAPPPPVTYEGDGSINVATRQGDFIGKFVAGTSAKVVIASCNSKFNAISGLLTLNGEPLKESLELMPGVYVYFPGARRIYENVTLYTVEEPADDNFPQVTCRIVDKTRDQVQALVGQGSFVDLGDSAVEDLDLSILREASVDALRDHGRYLVVPVADKGIALLNKWKQNIVEGMQAAAREFARERLEETGEVGVTCDCRKSWNHTNKKGERINLEPDVLVMSDKVVYIAEVKTSAGKGAVSQLEKSFNVVRRGLEEKIGIFEPLRGKELRGAIYSGTWSPSLKEEIEKHGWELWGPGGGYVRRGNCCDNAMGGIPGCPGSTSLPRAKAKGTKFPSVPQGFDLLKVGASRTSGLGMPHSRGMSGNVHEFRWSSGHRRAPHLRTVGVNASVITISTSMLSLVILR